MSVEAIQKVKEEEQKAQKILQNAREEAKKLVDDAKISARENHEKILEEARKERISALEDAKLSGEKKAMPIINEAKTKVKSIRSIPDEDLLDIVKTIRERIVMDSGNS